MASYAQLAREIDKLRAKAARFYKTDFHLHSPFSRDWMNDSGDSSLDRNTTVPVTPDRVKTFYQVCKDARLQLAVVTDHMRYSFGVQCRTFSRNIADSDKVCFLPGIELSTKIQ